MIVYNRHSYQTDYHAISIDYFHNQDPLKWDRL